MTEIWNVSSTDTKNVWNLHSKYERGMNNYLHSQNKNKEKLCIEWRREMNESRKLWFGVLEVQTQGRFAKPNSELDLAEDWNKKTI